MNYICNENRVKPHRITIVTDNFQDKTGNFKNNFLKYKSFFNLQINNNNAHKINDIIAYIKL